MERLDRSVAAEHRFDGRTAREILERAAMEQRRLDREHTDTYSLEELEEIAGQARISAEAVRAAIEAHSGDSLSHDAAAIERSSSRLRPGRTRQRTAASVLGRTLLASAGAVAFVALLITVPAIAHALFWTTIVLSLLLLLGASPF